MKKIKWTANHPGKSKVNDNLSKKQWERRNHNALPIYYVSTTMGIQSPTLNLGMWWFEEGPYIYFSQLQRRNFHLHIRIKYQQQNALIVKTLKSWINLS